MHAEGSGPKRQAPGGTGLGTEGRAAAGVPAGPAVLAGAGGLRTPHPGASITTLAGILGKSKSVVARPVAALTELGVLRRRRAGRDVDVEASAPVAVYLYNLEGGGR